MSTVIAIDGYVATGKGTVALKLARELDFLYLDTGAMYRAATLYMHRQGVLDADDQTKTEIMGQIVLSFHHNAQTDHDDIYLNGENVEIEIRQTRLSVLVKKIAGVSGVRAALVAQQQALGYERSLVVDGRDVGTVIFPDAKVKVFLVAEVEVRTERRYQQLSQAGQLADREAIRDDILARDAADYLGPNAVNHKAEDALIIDTTHMTIDEVVQKVKSLYRG